MSGEFVSGKTKGIKFSMPIIGTDYQMSSIGRVTEIPGSSSLKNRISTEKEKENFSTNMVEKEAIRHKYNFYCQKIGISRYVKVKPEYTKVVEKVYYRAKKDEKSTFAVVRTDNKGCILKQGLKTEAEAKKIALDYKKYNLEKDYLVIKIYFTYKYNCQNISKRILYGRTSLKEVGEMKSMPKKKPKSFMVMPEYYWAYAGVLTDYEYEYM